MNIEPDNLRKQVDKYRFLRTRTRFWVAVALLEMTLFILICGVTSPTLWFGLTGWDSWVVEFVWVVLMWRFVLMPYWQWVCSYRTPAQRRWLRIWNALNAEEHRASNVRVFGWGYYITITFQDQQCTKDEREAFYDNYRKADYHTKVECWS